METYQKRGAGNTFLSLFTSQDNQHWPVTINAWLKTSTYFLIWSNGPQFPVAEKMGQLQTWPGFKGSAEGQRCPEVGHPEAQGGCPCRLWAPVGSAPKHMAKLLTQSVIPWALLVHSRGKKPTIISPQHLPKASLTCTWRYILLLLQHKVKQMSFRNCWSWF